MVLAAEALHCRPVLPDSFITNSLPREQVHNWPTGGKSPVGVPSAEDARMLELAGPDDCRCEGCERCNGGGAMDSTELTQGAVLAVEIRSP